MMNPQHQDLRARERSERQRTYDYGRAPAQLTTLSSSALFQGSREIGIEHFGALYRLKITRQGKLILNK